MKQVLIIRSDLKMGKGKIAAQASHASVSAYIKTLNKNKDWVDEWIDHQKKIVLKVDSLEEMLRLFELLKKEFPCSLIKDAGHTQVAPGSVTALGIGPVPESKINPYIKNLKLL